MGFWRISHGNPEHVNPVVDGINIAVVGDHYD